MSTLPLLTHPAAGVYLSAEEERSLLERFIHHGDRKALDRIIVSHVRMVARIARAYRHFGVPMEDLVQEGCIGLQKAAESFDISLGFRFSTYASWCAHTRIKIYVITNARIVRGGVSAEQKSLFMNGSRLRAAFDKNGSAPAWEVNEKIAAATGTSVSDVERMSMSEVSLDCRVISGGREAAAKVDSLPDESPLPDELVDQAFTTSAVRSAVSAALDGVEDTRLLLIVQERWLCDEPRTLLDISKDLGISKERVRQLECAAIWKIKAELTSRGVTAAHI